jgi:hypothetical protein
VADDRHVLAGVRIDDLVERRDDPVVESVAVDAFDAGDEVEEPLIARRFELLHRDVFVRVAIELGDSVDDRRFETELGAQRERGLARSS